MEKLLVATITVFLLSGSVALAPTRCELGCVAAARMCAARCVTDCSRLYWPGHPSRTRCVQTCQAACREESTVCVATCRKPTCPVVP